MPKQIQIHIPTPVDSGTIKCLAADLKNSFDEWGIKTGRVSLADVGSEQVLMKIDIADIE